jgi:hypothetical protein
MTRVWTSIGAIAVAALTLTFTSAAGAHKLSAERAQRAVIAFAERKCEADPECVKSTARYCTAKGDHKRICDAFVVKRTAEGELVQCVTKVLVTIPRDSKKLTLKPQETVCD